jgi:invasion protein IalB
MLRNSGIIVVIAALVMGGAAVAQQAPTAPALTAPGLPAAGAAQPGARPAIGAAAQGQRQAQGNATDVQTFGDWTVRCFNVKTLAPCDMIQVAVNKEKKQRVSSVSLAYIPSRDNYATQIIVPLGVSVASGLTLSAGSQKIEGLKYRRCEHDGCYVETGVSKTALEALATGGNTGAITVALYRGNKPINLPLSLNGFAPAVNKLKELARAKAVATAPAGTTPAPAPAPATAPQQ